MAPILGVERLIVPRFVGIGWISSRVSGTNCSAGQSLRFSSSWRSCRPSWIASSRLDVFWTNRCLVIFLGFTLNLCSGAVTSG